MRSTFATLALSAFLALSTFATAQQGGDQAIYRRDSAQAINQAIAGYLNGQEQTSLLTPGEFVEWKLSLKAGQVVIAEARSSVLDAALEIRKDGVLLAGNDDRYPGDQRPLLLWRCEKDGEYLLHARSFKDKAGGQVMVRFNTYDCVDLSDTMVEREVDADRPFLLRIPMKAGEIKEQVTDLSGSFLPLVYHSLIAPGGLPDNTQISQSLQPAVYAVVAPVTGDYYLLQTTQSRGGPRGRIRVGTRTLTAAPLAGTESALSNVPVIWRASVKAGQLLEVTTPELAIGSKLVVTEKPDFAKWDLSKAETNPFFPTLATSGPAKGDAVTPIAAREGDGRRTVFYVWRDTELWIASNAVGSKDKPFSITLKPAASPLQEGITTSGNLKVANTDYWDFDAKVGEVITLNSRIKGFTPFTVVRDPEMVDIRAFVAPLDQTDDTWRMVVQKPGRYRIAVSSVGNGGGGEYQLSRKTLQPRDFSMASPAKGEISADQVHIWKFAATPTKPLLVQWASDNWDYDVAIYNERGEPVDFQRQEIDSQQKFGILKVNQPQTFLIVLTGRGQKANYSIQLADLPGYKPSKT